MFFNYWQHNWSITLHKKRFISVRRMWTVAEKTKQTILENEKR